MGENKSGEMDSNSGSCLQVASVSEDFYDDEPVRPLRYC